MLRYWILNTLLFCPGLLALGQNCLPPSYLPEDSVTICRILRSDSAREVSYCGRQFLGVPYVAHTLEIVDPERLVVNTRGLDCSTFMETAMALAGTARLLSARTEAGVDTLDLFCRVLEIIRYREGVIDGYTSRLHYICDWAVDNERMQVIEDITALQSTEVWPTRIGFMSANPEKYRLLTVHPEFIPSIREMEERCNRTPFTFLPKGKLPAHGLSWIREGDLIAMVTTIKGLDVSHVGIAVYCEGELHLMHASSIEKRVIVDPRPLSVQIGRKSCPGIRVFRLSMN